MIHDGLLEEWTILREWLPQDLDELAKRTKFIRRSSGRIDSELWLRLILMHVAGGLSLEQTMLRAAELGWAHLSAVALFKRLRNAQAMLNELCSHVLSQQRRLLGQSESWPSQWRIRLIDATDVQEPGSRGTDWRIHYSLRLPQMICDHCQVTDRHGGKRLGRFSFAPNDLVVADRGYSSRAGVSHVLESGAAVLLRWNPVTFPLEMKSGAGGSILTWLRDLPGHQCGETAVVFRHYGRLYPMRLCAVRKGRLVAQRAREKVSCKAPRRGRQLREETLAYADYIMVLCSVPRTRLSAAQALGLYRGRWQIELTFKRLKSLLDAGHVPKESDASACAWMQAKVLTALLIERTLLEGEFFSPWGHGLETGSATELVDSIQ